MKKNLFVKLFNLFLFALVSFAMSASLVGPAFAQPEQPAVNAVIAQGPKEPPSHPNCQFSPINVVVPLGKEVDFYILNPEVGVDYTWRFDDGDTGVGKNTKHAWSALGSYKMYVTAQGDEYNNSCYTWVTVVAPELPAVTQTPPTPPTGNNSAAENGTSASITVTGDNNASNSITCGNDCEITINNYPTDQVPPVTPVPPAGQSNIDKIIKLIMWLWTN